MCNYINTYIFIMVKNKAGGNRHKKMARKNVNAPVSTKLRLAKEDGEMYAKVTKLFGNGMAEILCNDKVARLLIIRRRFKGRNKRDNMIAMNSIVLVGIRNWEVRMGNKKEKADLLYVYSDHQLENLQKKATDINPAILNIGGTEEDDNGFEITEKPDWVADDETQFIGENTKVSDNDSNNKSEVKQNKITDKEPDFDWDDI